MFNAFGGRAGFDVDASHVFPQNVLAAITLVSGGAGDRAGLGCEARILLWSVAITALPGTGSDPMLLQQKTCVSGSNWLHSL